MSQLKTLNKRNNWKIDPDNITVWDNFFKPEYLKILKYRVLYGKYFDKKYDNYHAINYPKNQDRITELIVNELKQKINLPEFQKAWSFLYDEGKSGARLHSDPSLITLNTWVSDNESVKNKSKNGLVIYKIKPPSNWTEKDWNGDNDKITQYIKINNIKPVIITYKNNRAIFFNSCYFHASTGVSMKKGFEHSRISYTQLFGER